MIFEECLNLTKQKISYAVITIIDVRGSYPQDLGAKCIVTNTGLHSGTIGGGKIEAYAIQYAQNLLNLDKNQVKIKKWNLQKDIGMTCGGEVQCLFETYLMDEWQIVIFGAGHVSQALCRILRSLSCQISVIDSRKEWLEKLPKDITTYCTNEPENIIKNCSPKSFFISMTKGHATDVPLLKFVYDYHPGCPYVGVIGSHAKGVIIKKELQELGVSQDFLNKLYIPIGLPIGSNTPAEIAVSVSAQLLVHNSKTKTV